MTARLLVDCRCHLGECVIWDDRQNAVLFTSILDRKFHKLILSDDTENVQLESYELPKMLGAFGLLDVDVRSKDNDNDNDNDNKHHPGYIVAWEDGFQLYDLERGTAIGPMSRGETVNRSGLPNRLNDGRVDPTGKRFVCGGMAASPDLPLKVYKCEYDYDSSTSTAQGLKHSVLYDKILVTNSICWSLSGKEMYLADSPCRNIRKLEYDLKEGTISNEKVLHTKRTGFPDGSVVDSQGFLWNATWRQGEGTGMVDRIDPNTGDVVFTVNLPDETSEASCCCFGGEDLDILFITTAHENIDPDSEPHSGGLYAVKLPSGMTGCREKRFRTC
mmetsp:Transcript_12907/g.25837  ORF Transcript_12907/g.25837 Transcript_12907/m.25837 type:complete len:331 (-) Transcript_12907:70-1062(-)